MEDFTLRLRSGSRDESRIGEPVEPSVFMTLAKDGRSDLSGERLLDK